MFWNKKPDTEVVPVLPGPQQPSPPMSPALGTPSEGSPLETSLVDPTGYFRRYGTPTPVHDVRANLEFASCYDRRTRSPYWVVEHLTSASRKTKGGDRNRSAFTEDTNVPEKFRARLADYFRSGYDRGHQAPAANAAWSQQAMDETFLLTNISPQVGEGFNRDYWAHFERFTRNLTEKYASVRIVTGPLFLPKLCPDGKHRVTYEVIGRPPSIAVPTHFFKLVVGEDPILPSLPNRGVAVAAFVLPNAPISNDQPLGSFQLPVEAIERAAGVEFLPRLPENMRRNMCREIDCSIEVREFNDTVKKIAPPQK